MERASEEARWHQVKDPTNNNTLRKRLDLVVAFFIVYENDQFNATFLPSL